MLGQGISLQQLLYERKTYLEQVATNPNDSTDEESSTPLPPRRRQQQQQASRPVSPTAAEHQQRIQDLIKE
jgi:hypothetical protein